METALAMVQKERDRQDNKWGEQNHPPEIWVGILGEEYGEYCQVVNETVLYNGAKERKKGGTENMITELTHVAAVAVVAIENILRDAEHKAMSEVEWQKQLKQFRGMFQSYGGGGGGNVPNGNPDEHPDYAVYVTGGDGGVSCNGGNGGNGGDDAKYKG